MTPIRPLPFPSASTRSGTTASPPNPRRASAPSLPTHPVDSREALETTTQIARTQSLQRQFAAADATLDAVAPKLDEVPVRVRVRYLLERGRTRNSAGDKPAAMPLFTDALDACAIATRCPTPTSTASTRCTCWASPHPRPSSSTGTARRSRPRKASADPRARGWAGSLTHNIGWSYFDTGDPATALVYWQKALRKREAPASREHPHREVDDRARPARDGRARRRADDPDGPRRRDRERQRTGRLRLRGTGRDRDRARRQGRRARGPRRRTRC